MYQHGKRTKRKSGPRVFLQMAFILGLSFVVGAVLLKNDMASNNQEKTTVPILTEVAGAKDDTIEINEPLFTIRLPKDWVQSNRVQANKANYYEWKSTKQGGDDRLLRLHVDVMPESYKVARLLPVSSSSGGKLSVGNISGNCTDYAKDYSAGSNATILAKWENVVFNCDPISANQTIGTGTVDNGIAISVNNHSYFFYYQDHNVRIDDKMFVDIVKSFSAK